MAGYYPDSGRMSAATPHPRRKLKTTQVLHVEAHGNVLYPCLGLVESLPWVSLPASLLHLHEASQRSEQRLPVGPIFVEQFTGHGTMRGLKQIDRMFDCRNAMPPGSDRGEEGPLRVALRLVLVDLINCWTLSMGTAKISSRLTCVFPDDMGNLEADRPFGIVRIAWRCYAATMRPR